MISAKLRAVLAAAPFLIAACGKASSELAKADDKAPAAKVESLAATDMVLGDADAPVTIIEYASLTCPHCATFNEQVMPAIKEKYIDTGKVKLVFREFPTAPANYALIGSVLARCAADRAGPEAYFLVTDALFRAQKDWIKENPRAELAKIVAQAGMDEAALDTCLERKELVEVINKNAREAMEKFDITGTPTFIINGEKVGFRTKEEFEKLVADAVAKAEA